MNNPFGNNSVRNNSGNKSIPVRSPFQNTEVLQQEGKNSPQSKERIIHQAGESGSVRAPQTEQVVFYGRQIEAKARIAEIRGELGVINKTVQGLNPAQRRTIEIAELSFQKEIETGNPSASTTTQVAQTRISAVQGAKLNTAEPWIGTTNGRKAKQAGFIPTLMENSMKALNPDGFGNDGAGP